MNEIPHPGFDKPEEYETFTTTNGLEEAARKYKSQWNTEHPHSPDIDFIAGANWQKEQMLEKATEYEVGMHGEPITINLDKYVQRARGIFPGDKVRVIIVKEDYK